MNSEKGQALPLALLALAIGVLVIAPFLGHAGSTLTGSRIYGQAIGELYSCDTGVEHAIWNLTNGGLAEQLPSPGDEITYQLSETINDIAPSITVTAMGSYGGGYIYAFRGDTKKDFWKYDIASDTWTSMADAPDKVKEGGALTYAETYIYALQGKDKKCFWRYDIASDTWTSMADAPDKVKEGGALAYDGSSYIYALRGDGKKDFWRYDIASDSWTSMADAPDNVKEGGALTYDGTYIYAFRGDNGKDFWRYDIASDTWTSMVDAPDKVKWGGALTCEMAACYEIVSIAGDNTIRAVVRIGGETVSILSWQVE